MANCNMCGMGPVHGCNCHTMPEESEYDGRCPVCGKYYYNRSLVDERKIEEYIADCGKIGLQPTIGDYLLWLDQGGE